MDLQKFNLSKTAKVHLIWIPNDEIYLNIYDDSIEFELILRLCRNRNVNMFSSTIIENENEKWNDFKLFTKGKKPREIKN